MTKNFKQKVFGVVRSIPRGSVLTYREVAVRAGFPRAFRAVGSILKTNVDLGIPCHRVVRSDGAVGEYNRGIKNKIKKLTKEGVHIKRGMVV